MSENSNPNENSNYSGLSEPKDLGTTGGLYITLFNVPVGAFQLKVLILVGPRDEKQR